MTKFEYAQYIVFSFLFEVLSCNPEFYAYQVAPVVLHLF